METLLFFEKAIWFGFAALGFSILFNVPKRTLLIIFLLGAIGGITKIFLINSGFHIILATFIGASIIGVLSIPAAHNKHAPPLIFSIPALIPMVPGVFGYKTMLGIIKLTASFSTEEYSEILNSTINNGIKALLITVVLAAGASIPMLVTRKGSIKQIKK